MRNKLTTFCLSQFLNTYVTSLLPKAKCLCTADKCKRNVCKLLRLFVMYTKGSFLSNRRHSEMTHPPHRCEMDRCATSDDQASAPSLYLARVFPSCDVLYRKSEAEHMSGCVYLYCTHAVVVQVKVMASRCFYNKEKGSETPCAAFLSQPVINSKQPKFIQQLTTAKYINIIYIYKNKYKIAQIFKIQRH